MGQIKVIATHVSKMMASMKQPQRFQINPKKLAQNQSSVVHNSGSINYAKTGYFFTN